MITFVTPQETKRTNESTGVVERNVDLKHYRKRIEGYNKVKWFLILRCKMSKQEVENMTLDELMEAYAAHEIFMEEERKRTKRDSQESSSTSRPSKGRRK